MRASQGNLKVAKNEPISLAGHDGYSLVTEFKNARGLRYERIVVGFADPEGYYTMSFQAPVLYYFDRDHAVFDVMLRSFRVASGSTPAREGR